MAVELDREIVELLEDNETVTVLATSDAKGNPHAVANQSFQLGADGKLIYLELLESSQTNKDLVRSIWFGRKVALALKGRDGRSFQIKGSPVKALVSGPAFQKHYVEVRKKLGDVDLAAVWIIEPEEVLNESYPVRKAHEEATRPYFSHLDRLAK